MSHPTDPSPRSPWRVRIIAGALYALLMVGATVDATPEFDALFGVDSYGALGVGWLLLAAVPLTAILRIDSLADWLAASAGRVSHLLPSAARVPVFLAVQLVLFAWLTDTTLSGDGVHPVYLASRGEVYPSQALVGLLHTAAMAVFDVDAQTAIRWTSCLSGVVFSWFALRLAHTCTDDAARRVTIAAVLLTGGAAALFFGSVEVYAPVAAALLLFLWLGVRDLRNGALGLGTAGAAGLAVALHGLMLVVVPALAFVLWAARTRTLRGTLAAAAAFVAPIAATGAALYWGVWDGRPPEGGQELYGSFLGATGGGPLLPLTLGPTNVTHRYAIFDLEHLVGVLNVLVLAAPLGVGMTLLGRARSRTVAFAALVTAPLVLFALVWDVDFAFRQDRDLFSLIGVPLGVLGALRLGRVGGAREAVRFVALGLFAFAPFVVANAGDAVQQRTYAQRMSQLFTGLADDGAHGATAANRPNAADAAAHWRSELERLDTTGVLASLADLQSAAASDRVATLESVLEREPSNHDALVALAELRAHANDLEPARQLLVRALRTPDEGRRTPVRRMLANIALAEGRPDEAIRQLERGIREEVLRPRESARSLELLARVRRERGDTAIADALEELARARLAGDRIAPPID